MQLRSLCLAVLAAFSLLLLPAPRLGAEPVKLQAKLESKFEPGKRAPVLVLSVTLAGSDAKLPPATAEEIPGLVAQLAGPRTDEHTHAMIRLVETGAPVIDPLAGALRSASGETLVHTALVLALIGTDSAVAALRGVPVNNFIEAISVPASDEQLKSQQSAMAFVLTATGTDRAMRAAVSLLESDAPNDLRIPVILGIMRWNLTRYAPAVEARLRDRDPQVRTFAAFALSQLRGKKAVEPLLAALPDPHPGARVGVITALTSLADRRATDSLITVLLFDESPEIRSTAAVALGSIDDAKAVPFLLLALKDDDHAMVRVTAAQSLMYVKATEEVLAALLVAENDPDPDVRNTATESLKKLREPKKGKR